MNILFRVDAGDKIGLGHYFRTITLAKALYKRGIGVTITHKPSPFWTKVVLPFPTVTLEEGKEESHTLQLIKKGDFSVYYVDGIIAFTEAFIESIRKSRIKVVFYQNNSDTKHLCDIFILPSLRYDSSFFKNFSEKTKVFTGLDYVIFNEKVYQLASKRKPIRKIAENIGIVTGGSDPKGVLLTIHSLIEHATFQHINFIYFYGEDFLHKENIPAHTKANVQFSPFDLKAVSNMDIVICTFGVSTYELMYLGIPTISIGHQFTNAAASKKVEDCTKGIIDLGLIDDINATRLNDTLGMLIDQPQQREALSKNAMKAIDAKGIDRIIQIVTSS